MIFYQESIVEANISSPDDQRIWKTEKNNFIFSFRLKKH